MSYLCKHIKTYGADPEFFVWDADKCENVSPHDITKGTKIEPEPLGEGWSIQIDGLALEVNTPLFPSLASLFKGVNSFLPKLETLMQQRTGRDLYLSRDITHTFSKEVWDTVPEENKVLGCSPDFSAWGLGKVNPVPTPPEERFRTTAGHIAFGYRDNLGPNLLESSALILNLLECRAMGAFLNREDIHGEQLRRELYGKPDAFRPKSFGTEWRAPSNYWCFEPHKVIRRLNWSDKKFFDDVLLTTHGE